MSTPTYLAIDLETTGLNPRTDAILEVAAFVLDENYVELDRFVFAVECDDETLDRAEHVVLHMHLNTGLIDRLATGSGWWVGRTGDGPSTLNDVEHTLHRLIDDFPERPVLVGQGVHFDRSFLREHMPNVERRFSHRMVDARTVMQLAPELPWPEPEVKHVAEHDLDATVDALRMARGLMSYCGDTYGDLVSARDAVLASARGEQGSDPLGVLGREAGRAEHNGWIERAKSLRLAMAVLRGEQEGTP